MSINPRKYAIELKDINGVRIGYINNIVESLSWEWLRTGGCGSCTMKARQDYDGVIASSFAEDYEVNIYAPDASGTSALWYGGYIDRVKPSMTGQGETFDLSILGWVNQLKRCVVRTTNYYGMDISLIVKSAVEVFGTGITDITSTASDYTDSGFIADKVYFNEDLHQTITKLADIAGKREWGCRADKSFFFLKRDDSIQHNYSVTENFTSYSPQRDYNSIVNKIYLEGGEGYNNFFSVVNRINTREEIVRNSSITTQSVAMQFARSYPKEKGVPKRSYTAQLNDIDTRIENTIPLGKAMITIEKGLSSKYDVATNLYDSGIKYDGGNISLQIDKIKYTLKDDKIDADITFGVTPANIVDKMGEMDYQLKNEGNL